jgi:alpha-beta hydrolase superfamily lysophospholipase
LFRPRKLFPVPLSDPELFTTTPRWLDFLRHDKLALHQATARFLVESVRLDVYLNWVPKYVHIPCLLMLAQRDRIIHNVRTIDYVKRFASTEKKIIEYPGAHHTLEFEPETEPFLGDLTKWFAHQSHG